MSGVRSVSRAGEVLAQSPESLKVHGHRRWIYLSRRRGGEGGIFRDHEHGRA